MPTIHPDPAVLHMLYCTAHQCTDLPQFVAIMQTVIVSCLLIAGAMAVVIMLQAIGGRR